MSAGTAMSRRFFYVTFTYTSLTQFNPPAFYTAQVYFFAPEPPCAAHYC